MWLPVSRWPLTPLLLLFTILLLLLPACTDDESNPLAAREAELVGRWRLDLPAVAADELALTLDLGRDRGARHRLDGTLLRRLREVLELYDVDLGPLRELSAIERARVSWDGGWSLTGDSLRLEFTQFHLDVLGDLPVVGLVAVPVYTRQLAAAERVSIAYSYRVTDARLVLRGAAASAGLAGDLAAAQTAGLDPLGRQALELAGQVLLDTYQQSQANEFVYLRE